MKRILAVCVLALIALPIVRCGSARRGLPLIGPLDLTAEEKAGERAFMEYCSQCHPNGESGLGPAINDKPLPGWLIEFQVRNGLGAMPAFSEEVVSDEELDEIVAYLKRLRRAG